MQREIKFRGYSTALRIWVYSYLIIDNGKSIIINDDQYIFVKSETVGQYTGLKDKNGNEIYEGDIVEYEDYSGGMYIFKEQPMAKGVISIPDLLNGIYLRGLGSFDDGSKVEIIGNIHDNPELLEVSE